MKKPSRPFLAAVGLVMLVACFVLGSIVIAHVDRESHERWEKQQPVMRVIDDKDPDSPQPHDDKDGIEEEVRTIMIVEPASEIDYAKHDPLQVLEILAASRSDWVGVGDAPKDWIRKGHIPKLLAKLSSKKGCAGTHSYRDSRAVGIGGYGPEKKGRSTIGHEAAHMIASYKHGLYPKSPAFSVDWVFDHDSLRKWHAAAKKK